MIENAKNTIGFFEHQMSGCFWYRTKRPLETLNKAGIDAKYIQIESDVYFYDQLKSVQLYGIYPFQFYKTLQTLKDDGIKIVYDMDDAVDLIDVNNPFYYAVKKDANSSNEILKYADHITVATSYIKDILSKKTNKLITIVPNSFDEKEWLYPRPVREGIRIGFVGSCTHIADLILVLPAIINLQTKYNITFLIMGFGTQSYSEWYRDFSYSCTPEALKQLEFFNSLMTQIRFEWVPYVDFVNYPSTLINLSLDIGICPLQDIPFNKARSASKAMEYTLSGALAIASNLLPYQTDKNSILVNDDGWEDALEFYINNKEKREEMIKSHLEWTRDNRNAKDQVELLKSIYLS